MQWEFGWACHSALCFRPLYFSSFPTEPNGRNRLCWLSRGSGSGEEGTTPCRRRRRLRRRSTMYTSDKRFLQICSCNTGQGRFLGLECTD
uniref:Uncharacterized protein n=1 Tax=Arundo donax TaxID=35708 RepID=A0A0A9FQX6_ARUDO